MRSRKVCTVMFEVSITRSAAMVIGSRSLRSQSMASRRLTSAETSGCLRRVSA